MERRERQWRHLGAGKHASTTTSSSSASEQPSSPKKLKLTTQVAGEASVKPKVSFSPMVAIPTLDSRPLSCYRQYNKWTFPGSYQHISQYSLL
jgi:hypothetical protein